VDGAVENLGRLDGVEPGLTVGFTLSIHVIDVIPCKGGIREYTFDVPALLSTGHITDHINLSTMIQIYSGRRHG